MKRVLIVLLIPLLLASCSLHLLEKQDDDLEEAGNFEDTLVTSDTDWNVLILTDSHVGRDSDSYPENHRWFKDWYLQNASSLDLKAVIHLGDITDDSKKSQYLLARDQYVTDLENVTTTVDDEAGKIPFYATPGNHDVRGDGRDYFLKYFGKGEWKLVLGDLSLYILDSGNRYFGGSQIDKLEDALEHDSNEKLFLSHMPLSDQDIVYFYLTLTDEDERARLIHDMAQYHVRLFIDGHRHRLVGPYKIRDDLKEISLSCMHGPDVRNEQPPSWYILRKNGDTLTLTEYTVKKESQIQEPLTDEVLSVTLGQ